MQIIVHVLICVVLSLDFDTLSLDFRFDLSVIFFWLFLLLIFLWPLGCSVPPPFVSPLSDLNNLNWQLIWSLGYQEIVKFKYHWEHCDDRATARWSLHPWCAHLHPVRQDWLWVCKIGYESARLAMSLQDFLWHRSWATWQHDVAFTVPSWPSKASTSRSNGHPLNTISFSLMECVWASIKLDF